MNDTAMLPEIEIRILGTLVEKAIATPEYYPMTLKGLTLGCNQKTSRYPVTDYDESEVQAALDSLRDRRLVMRVDMAGSRVPKFRHRMDEQWELDEQELALLGVLFLRGAQTLGQLRQRTERMASFRDLQAVKETLDRMQGRELEPNELVHPLPLRPGSKEVRYVHSFAATETFLEDDETVLTHRATLPPVSSEEEVAALTERVVTLERELDELRQAFESFKAQF